MDFEELKKKSNRKILLRGKSGRGKTLKASKLALSVAEAGGKVSYVDTESEGSTTIVNLIEDGEFDEDVVENLEYVQVDNYSELMEFVDDHHQRQVDLLVVDTLDHKHTYVLKEVTGAKLEADANWNEYPQIYSKEKELMGKFGKPKTNIIATLDPDSGKMDKPKGAQTNIHGYFDVVIDLNKSGNEWGNVVRNYVGQSKAIGNSVSNIDDHLVEDLIKRIRV